MFQVLKIVFCIILSVWTIVDFVGIFRDEGDQQFEDVVLMMYVNPFLWFIWYLIFCI